MITVLVTTGNPDIQVTYNSNTFYFPATTSKADYSSQNDTLILQCPPIALNIAFPANSYDFTIDGTPWGGTFANLAQEFNKNIFTSASVSPAPTTGTVIRAAAALTGAYVASNSIEVTGRAQVHLDFTIGNNGGTLANSGCVVAIVEVSDDNSNWRLLNNLTASATLVADGAPSPYQAGTVFRQFTAEYGPTAIPYVTGNLPSAPIRLSYATGYGRYYRVKVRASDTAGISTGVPATFPDLAITASLQ